MSTTGTPYQTITCPKAFAQIIRSGKGLQIHVRDENGESTGCIKIPVTLALRELGCGIFDGLIWQARDYGYRRVATLGWRASAEVIAARAAARRAVNPAA